MESLPKFDFLTVISKAVIRKGVEYIQCAIVDDKAFKKVKIMFEEYLDTYFIKTLKDKSIDVYNYNNGNDWCRDM